MELNAIVIRISFPQRTRCSLAEIENSNERGNYPGGETSSQLVKLSYQRHRVVKSQLELHYELREAR